MPPSLISSLIFTCARNEGPFLLEWVAYHRALGFTDVLIFTNDCEDGTDAMAARLAELGLAQHVPNRDYEEKGPQWTALHSKPLKEALARADWAAHLDVDEFLNITTTGGLDGLVSGLDGDAMAIPWRFFGNGGIMGFVDELVTTQFTRTSAYPVRFPRQAMMYKSLFRPSRFDQAGIHAPRAPGAAARVWLNGDGQPAGPDFGGTTPLLTGTGAGNAMAQINHYAVKSADSFLVKSARGLPNHRHVPIDLNYWVLRNPGAEEDTTLADKGRDLQAEVTRLRQDAALDRLHVAACDWHRDKAWQVLASEDGVALYTGIAMTGASRMPAPPEIARIYQAMRKVYGGGAR